MGKDEYQHTMRLYTGYSYSIHLVFMKQEFLISSKPCYLRWVVSAWAHGLD